MRDTQRHYGRGEIQAEEVDKGETDRETIDMDRHRSGARQQWGAEGRRRAMTGSSYFSSKRSKD